VTGDRDAGEAILRETAGEIMGLRDPAIDPAALPAARMTRRPDGGAGGS